jgi:hypothetical protein
LEVAIAGTGQFDYAAGFGDYAVEKDTESLRIESIDSDGVCDIREIRRASIHGYLGLDLIGQIDPGTLLKAIEDGRVRLDLFADKGEILRAEP